MSVEPNNIYAVPKAYDLAFSYRNYSSETLEFLDWYAQLKPIGNTPKTALELACGPARHLLELARRGCTGTGVDISMAMCGYANFLAHEEKLAVNVYKHNMVSFNLQRKYDLILLLLNSVSHIIDENALRSHFESVRRHLSPTGMFIIESSRLASKEHYGGHSWQGTAELGTVEVEWACEPNVERARITGILDGRNIEIEEEFPMRKWLTKELIAAANTSGLALLATVGDFSEDPIIECGQLATFNSSSGLQQCFIFSRIEQW